MQDMHQAVKKMEAQLQKMDQEIAATFKQIEDSHLELEIPVPLRKKMQELTEIQKDLSDSLHDLKGAMDNSWENLEENAVRLHKKLTQAIKEISNEMN